MKKTLIAAAVAATFVAAPGFGANLVINNLDPPGVGFNDPTPAAPVGGNTGTTVGAQRLIAYGKALELWGNALKSDATIVVQGSFAGLSCTATGGTLAQAGAIQIFADFPNAPLSNHWYGSALANSISGLDLTPGPLDPVSAFDPASPANDDILANFNGNVGKPNCIAGPGWYYGLDSNPGPGQIDFLDTFMHEVAHGLGFQNFVNEGTGSRPGGLPDVYMANTLDLVSKKQWNTMTGAEIIAAAVKTGEQVWTGPAVSANAGDVLGPYEGIRTTGALNIDITYGTAAFGPLPNATNFTGQVVLATDGTAAVGGTFTDGCEAITAPVAGKIALVDRGLCGFAVKAKNAQNAGATGVIIANTLGRSEFGMAGSDPTIVIASIGISNASGDAIKAALPDVSIEYFIDPTRLAGTTDGYVRLYAPGTYEPGSSISHFDTVASPNLLMEPAITGTLRANENLDLTPALMADVGWKMETLKVGSCDTGVANVLPNGALLHVQVEACAVDAKNLGQFVSCVNRVTNGAREAGFLTGNQQGKITSCTARAK